MKNLCVPALVILGLMSVPLWAHHSWPVSMDRLVTVKGTVTEFSWANPHPMITVEVPANDGKMEKWTIGGPALNRMTANGWSKTTVKPGDTITVTGGAAKSGAHTMRCTSVTLADGLVLRS